MFKELKECMRTIINQLEKINNETNYKTTKFRAGVEKAKQLDEILLDRNSRFNLEEESGNWKMAQETLPGLKE